MTALSQALEEPGRLKGKRKALRTVLEARFGTLPTSVLHRIDTADEADLDRLIVRAAIIERLEAL